MKRNDDPKEMTVIDPAFLAEHAASDESLQDLKKDVIVPYLKITQAMTSDELKDKVGGDGVACIPSAQAIIAKKGEPFLFVPLFFFKEFCKWKDLKDKEGSAILERTFDPTSDLAKRAQDKLLRKEKYEHHDDWYFRYVEHLNYVGVIYKHESFGTAPLVIGFSRGSHGTGRSFATAISMRKIRNEEQVFTPPLWSQVWEMKVEKRTNQNSQSWWGLGFGNPNVSYIEQEEAPLFKQAHLDHKKLFQENRLKVEVDEEEASTTNDEDAEL